MAIWIETQVHHVHPIPQNKIEIIQMTSLRFLFKKRIQLPHIRYQDPLHPMTTKTLW